MRKEDQRSAAEKEEEGDLSAGDSGQTDTSTTRNSGATTVVLTRLHHPGNHILSLTKATFTSLHLSVLLYVGHDWLQDCTASLASTEQRTPWHQSAANSILCHRSRKLLLNLPTRMMRK
ncbi:uncharacterized protein MYCGRDRAFT_97821 [Zymoseptoria tritici IPO323]|uniref:Uncharacterized protein n=1 Tax=Zymoseptoria tritici (strain CBS 115943 / IPO323) TaxID=336722 RepID=F9XRH1_ZYMTI|nr:uncharacterized protein MYCGRDRAFT_97821 [Zymoseptoria tritici IPO323]EGP82135.1 hypothetical protein MYCGRDRAFT_97821 [Zymoseptoria tritici IPO323]